MKSEREILEDAIVADPEDRAAHAAYADLLAGQGDPRGEFIRVQLALEDEAVPAGQRQALQQRERELLEAHQRDWLGPLAPALLDREGLDEYERSDPSDHPRWRFVRGLLAELAFPLFKIAHGRALAAGGAATRFVRRVLIDEAVHEVAGRDYQPGPNLPEGDDLSSLHLLGRWPNLASLRALRMGAEVDEDYTGWCGFRCSISGEDAHAYVERMPRLEELYLLASFVDTSQLFALPLPHLRVLQVYHGEDYPLGVLATNPTLGRLTHLLCHPHAILDEVPITLDGLRAVCRSPHLTSLSHLRLRLTIFGDEGVREIVESGLLKRLRSLDLRHGRVSDAGARLLAESPGARGLEHLDLSRNELTAAGVRALQGLNARLDVGYQHESTAGMGDGELMNQEFLFQGDIE